MTLATVLCVVALPALFLWLMLDAVPERGGRAMNALRKIVEWFRLVRRGTYPDRWQDRLWQGHVTFGPVTIYGANAMHWAINVWFRGTYWCFHPTTKTFGGHWPWYFYISPNATPWAATFKLGPGAYRYGR